MSSGLPAESLFVEISERLVDPDEEDVAANMHALRALGVKLLLDDFGQGQTSLSFLHQLPVTGIKLDRLLVVNSVRSETERAVVEAIIDLSDRLGLTVIAEGIETEDHLRAITTAGCHIVQGFHFHPPMELDRVRALLRDQARRRQPWTATASVEVTGERIEDPIEDEVR